MARAICPDCEREGNVPDTYIGRLVRCPECGISFTVEPEPIDLGIELDYSLDPNKIFDDTPVAPLLTSPSTTTTKGGPPLRPIL